MSSYLVLSVVMERGHESTRVSFKFSKLISGSLSRLTVFISSTDVSHCALPKLIKLSLLEALFADLQESRTLSRTSRGSPSDRKLNLKSFTLSRLSLLINWSANEIC